ncbi:thiamine pyrophosphate-binding protein [Anaeromyxobacter diazotrophicus]|uniref:Acetolactate synthase I/II/III large subunit n=1 Tax=Anaeromyxobacter diazotrophicus TaxID=2590199 RepID=A0A7I9VQZ6_9BACT|nr:thiamine pyrophosphate-binding protein [Anaeromyxobacter diazotrophicus]GEJ58771.1 acetolactate synthase I/II/III large subunit [Anaeromyxobacter diazotrophicus]
MGTLTGGQLVARMLRREGVTTAFTLSGLHVAPIYVGCVDEGIQLVDTRHEQAAAHAADAWARLTRRLGACIVTAGPGVTGTVTAVANAWAASVPLLVLGGAAPTFNQGRGSLQEMPQTQLFAGITKWSDRVPSPELVPSFLARAFRVARAGRPGPVFLEIPWDVLSNGADEELAAQASGYRTAARSPGDPEQLDAAQALLARAERPVLVGGSSIWWDGAVEALAALADATGVPVYLNGMGRGCLPPGHPSFFQGSRKEALAQADVVLVVGTPLDFRVGYGTAPTFAADAKVIQVDGDAAEIGRNRPIDVGIVGDSRSVLQQLASGARRWGGDAWRKRLRAVEEERAARQRRFEESDQRPIHHFRLARALDTVAGRSDVTYVGDGGNVVAVAAKVLRVPRPGRWLDPGPLGCLGVGAPFAIAAKLLAPERPVCVVQGDGAFGLNGMDYETAVRFKLPMVVVVGNDAAWGQILIPQRNLYGEDRSPATRLAPTRYDRLVEAMGGRGEHVDDPKDLIPALERAFASGTVYCVDVAIDPEAAAAAGAAGYAV